MPWPASESDRDVTGAAPPRFAAIRRPPWEDYNVVMQIWADNGAEEAVRAIDSAGSG
eukprot:gene7886-13284_t